MAAGARRPRRRWPAIAGALLGVVVALGAWTAWELHLVRQDLAAGQRALSSLSVADVGRIDQIAQEARVRLERAHRRADGSLGLRALLRVPGVGRQVEGATAMTGTAVDLGEAAERAGWAVSRALDHADGPEGRVRALTVTERELARLARAVRAAGHELPDGLVGPLASARRSLEVSFDAGAAQLDEAGSTVRSLRDLLGGRQTLLLLAANNAEMAAGAG